MATTSDPSLPPEIGRVVEQACAAIHDLESGARGSMTTEEWVETIRYYLAPRLADRDAAARGLREALEEIDRWARDRELAAAKSETALRCCGEIARAALSASPDPDPCSDCDGTGIGGHGGTCPTCGGSRAAPVSVPEQEEGRAFLARHGALDDTLVAADPALAAASSSSSEEGERADDADAIGLIYDALHAERFAEPDGDGMRERATIVFATLCETWLRERLTSDEAVTAAVAASMPRLWSPERRAEIAATALTTAAAALLNDTKETSRDGD